MDKNTKINKKPKIPKTTSDLTNDIEILKKNAINTAKKISKMDFTNLYPKRKIQNASLLEIESLYRDIINALLEALHRIGQNKTLKNQQKSCSQNQWIENNIIALRIQEERNRLDISNVKCMDNDKPKREILIKLNEWSKIHFSTNQSDEQLEQNIKDEILTLDNKIAKLNNIINSLIEYNKMTKNDFISVVGNVENNIISKLDFCNEVSENMTKIGFDTDRFRPKNKSKKDK